MHTFRQRISSRPPGSAKAGSAVLPVCLGFIAGAVFWHFLGSSDLAGRVVLAHPALFADERAAEVPVRLEPDGLMATGRDAIARCARLTLDRRGGRTDLAPCGPQADRAGSTRARAVPRSDLSTPTISPDN